MPVSEISYLPECFGGGAVAAAVAVAVVATTANVVLAPPVVSEVPVGPTVDATAAAGEAGAAGAAGAAEVRLSSGTVQVKQTIFVSSRVSS